MTLVCILVRSENFIFNGTVIYFAHLLSDIVFVNSIISGGYQETMPIAVHSDKCCVKDPISREMNCDVSDDFGYKLLIVPLILYIYTFSIAYTNCRW